MSHEDLAIENSTRTMATDSLSVGLSFLLFSNILQRGIGFLRNLGVCHFLTDEQLGMWALASSFFVLAAPLAVLGLPGSFGRFVEYYRQQGQLGVYLKRTRCGAVIGCGVLTLLILNWPEFSSWLIFGQAVGFASLLIVVVTLMTVVIFNYLTELLSGLRQPRVVSTMQCINSIVFTITAILWLTFSQDWQGLVMAFAIAAACGSLPGLFALRRRDLDPKSWLAPLPARIMLRRVLPFAIAMWSMNLLSNLFDVMDRYMLLHWSDTLELGQALVGQYHSGRIVPALLTSVAMMLGGMLLPYLSADWETGKTDKVHRDLQTTFKLTALGFGALSIGAMTVAPWLFDDMLAGKFQDGLAIMPATLAQCTWSALALLMFNYLWCREKGLLIGLTMAIGLVLNLQLNLTWIPVQGLQGAVAATTAASLLILVMTLVWMHRLGCRIRPATLAMGLLPIFGIYSHLLAAVAISVTVIVTSRTNWVFTSDEKRVIERSLLPLVNRFGLQTQTLWAKV